MRRREFIAGFGSAAAWPVVARAQQPAVPVIGFLHTGTLETSREFVPVFHRGLSETGYVFTSTIGTPIDDRKILK